MISKLLDVLNDLRPGQILLLAGSATVLMFAIVYFSLSSATGPQEDPAEPARQVAMESVVVAKTDIAPRALIRENMLQVKEMPADTIPKGAVRETRAVLGHAAISNIYAGDILTGQKVYTDATQAGFIGAIPPDCRAVSVSVSDVTGVAGFAKPGDYVDIVLVEKGERSSTSRILLQNVLLLSINKSMTAQEEDGAQEGEASNGNASSTTPIDNPAIATVALQPDEALQLVSAASVGEIYLMLRPLRPSDMYVSATDYTLQKKNDSPRPLQSAVVPQPAPSVPSAPPMAAAAPTAPAEASAASSGIEIIQGDQVVRK